MLNTAELGALLYSYTADKTGGVATISDASAPEKTWLLYAINGAQQEMRSIAPHLFKQRLGIRLGAPQSGTIQLGADKQTIDDITLTDTGSPFDGCTIRVGADRYDNEYLDDSSLAQPATLAGSQSFTMWMDCWTAGAGLVIERFLGDIRADGRVLTVASARDDLRRRNVGDYGSGLATTERLRNPVGEVRMVFGEMHARAKDTDTTAFATSRLRFSPMPSAETVVEADVVISSQPVVSADLSTGIALSVPGNLHESVLLPIALQLYTKSPWFRSATGVREIQRAYEAAKQMLRDYSPLQETQGQIVVMGY